MHHSTYLVEVTDLDTNETTTYDWSDNNWAKRPACMKGGLVHMWTPNELKKCTGGGAIITSGRRWALKKREGR